MGDKKIEIVYGEEKNILYWALEQPRQNKNLCTDTTSPTKQPRKDPFHLYSLRPNLPSVSTASRGGGHPSLVSMVIPTSESFQHRQLEQMMRIFKRKF
jgi:hypothetical protein